MDDTRHPPSPMASLTASAPPAPWAPPATDSPRSPEQVSLVPDGPARRSRGLVFGIVAVVAIVALGIGVLIALRGGGGGDGGESIGEVEDASAFSLSAAAEAATAATTIRYTIDMSMGELGAFSMAGGVDNDAQLMTVNMDVGTFFGGDAGMNRLDAIIDVGDGVMYMSNPGVGFPTDAAWISMDLAEIAAQSGMTVEDFRDQMAANPFDVAALFTDVGDMVDLGPDTIDGVTVQHYQVVIDFAEAIEANPQLGQQIDLDDFDGALPSELLYDVWVTEDNQLRRVVFSMDVIGQEMTVEMNITEVDEPLDVRVPGSDEVMDVTDLLGL